MVVSETGEMLSPKVAPPMIAPISTAGAPARKNRNGANVPALPP